MPFIRETIDEVDDLLTLTGLRLIWERNQRERRGRQTPAVPRAIAGSGTSGVARRRSRR